MAVETGKVTIRSHLLDSSVKNAATEQERRAAIFQYLQECPGGDDAVRVPDFERGLEWLNCKEELSFAGNLSGKVVILDFFTYCCINCMHILPDLEALEERYKDTDGVVVIGVHSAKFENEKTSANILNAVLRYGMTHPVVNDANATGWHRLGVSCWPTLMFISPRGELLYQLVGEGHREQMLRFVDVAVQHYGEELNRSALPLQLARECLPRSPLLYPSKICSSQNGERLFVADTGHHRVLVLNKEWAVERVIGGPQPGRQDGDAVSARFHSPQGLACNEEALFVADTDNHLIRKVSLKTFEVSTVVGTGDQGTDKEGGAKGLLQPISSPWDLQFGPAPGGDKNGCEILYIAMAGTHQVWAYFLADAMWLRGSSHLAGTTLRFAGDGTEANRNNSYPHKASFAQPSGLALDRERKILFVADSESSSVRCIHLDTGAVKNVVGAAPDPTDLFAFGDKDGRGLDAKLQHPLAVAWDAKRGLLHVADSYNHKIKQVAPSTRQCTTLSGSSKAALQDGCLSVAAYSEPGGLCVSSDGQLLLVADTNNHAIRAINFDADKVSQVVVTIGTPQEECDKGGLSQSMKRLTPKSVKPETKSSLNVLPNRKFELVVNIRLPAGCHLTEGANSRWQVALEGNTIQLLSESRGQFEEKPVIVQLAVPSSGPPHQLQIEALIYYCRSEGTCHMHACQLVYPVAIQQDGVDSAAVVHMCM